MRSGELFRIEPGGPCRRTTKVDDVDRRTSGTPATAIRATAAVCTRTGSRDTVLIASTRPHACGMEVALVVAGNTAFAEW
jgi:hypothetical protein